MQQERTTAKIIIIWLADKITEALNRLKHCRLIPKSVAEQSSSLADKVVKGSGTREEKTTQLQDMIDKGLPVPEWMIQAYELTPKSD